MTFGSGYATSFHDSSMLFRRGDEENRHHQLSKKCRIILQLTRFQSPRVREMKAVYLMNLAMTGEILGLILQRSIPKSLQVKVEISTVCLLAHETDRQAKSREVLSQEGAVKVRRKCRAMPVTRNL